MNSQEYSSVSQIENTEENQDNPPEYQEVLAGRKSSILRRISIQNTVEMSDLESCCSPNKNRKTKLAIALAVVLIGIIIACIADSYHKIHEGNVGVYYKYGALQERVSDPGVHFLLPFIEDFKEVRIRPETFTMEDVRAITKDGIENTFKELTTITTVRKDKLVPMTKKFGTDFKKALVFDRIKEELRIFCANHTIDEVYNTMFLDIVDTVLTNVRTSIKRLGEEGVEILNLVIPKPEIPADIAHNYKQVKVQWTEQLVATQQQKTEKIKKETELIKALADAEREKQVLEIHIEEKILEKEGEKNISMINNEIRKEAEENDAQIKKYKIEQEALANAQLHTPEYVKLHLAKSISNNTKFYFSENSAVGSILAKILGNE